MRNPSHPGYLSSSVMATQRTSGERTPTMSPLSGEESPSDSEPTFTFGKPYDLEDRSSSPTFTFGRGHEIDNRSTSPRSASQGDGTAGPSTPTPGAYKNKGKACEATVSDRTGRASAQPDSAAEDISNAGGGGVQATQGRSSRPSRPSRLFQPSRPSGSPPPIQSSRPHNTCGRNARHLARPPPPEPNQTPAPRDRRRYIPDAIRTRMRNEALRAVVRCLHDGISAIQQHHPGVRVRGVTQFLNSLEQHINHAFSHAVFDVLFLGRPQKPRSRYRRLARRHHAAAAQPYHSLAGVTTTGFGAVRSGQSLPSYRTVYSIHPGQRSRTPVLIDSTLYELAPEDRLWLREEVSDIEPPRYFRRRRSQPPAHHITTVPRGQGYHFRRYLHDRSDDDGRSGARPRRPWYGSLTTSEDTSSTEQPGRVYQDTRGRQRQRTLERPVGNHRGRRQQHVRGVSEPGDSLFDRMPFEWGAYLEPFPSGDDESDFEAPGPSGVRYRRGSGDTYRPAAPVPC